MPTGMTSPVVAPIATIFAINEGFVLPALEGLTEDELWRAPTGRNNALLWIAGHVVQTRATILQLLGDPFDTGWGPVFDRGAPAPNVDDARRYPSRSDIAKAMGELTPRLHAKLASLDEASLAAPARLQVPGTHTVADELAFFALHESYHVGQLAFVRKGLGIPGWQADERRSGHDRPPAGGRVYDRGVDGSECQWARGLVYEPPDHVVTSWDINPQWQIETDYAKTSEVDVGFVAEATGRTRVELEHRHLERHGQGWERVRDDLAGEGGWPGCIRRFAERLGVSG